MVLVTHICLQNTNILKNIELYTLNRQIVRYVNYISIKLLLKKNKREKRKRGGNKTDKEKKIKERKIRLRSS